jgi:hypothetical protein
MQKGIRLECGSPVEKGYSVPGMFVRETSS